MTNTFITALRQKFNCIEWHSFWDETKANEALNEIATQPSKAYLVWLYGNSYLGVYSTIQSAKDALWDKYKEYITSTIYDEQMIIDAFTALVNTNCIPSFGGVKEVPFYYA